MENPDLGATGTDFIVILQYILITLSFFCKQPVYKQLVLGWQIGKQLSGLNPLSIRNNKNYGLRENGIFPLKEM